MIETAVESPFTILGLGSTLTAAVHALGYEEPTAVQREAIPPLVAGRDVLGQAATGTGKTAAFALPLLQRLIRPANEKPTVRGLILVPTRELAMQVAQAVHLYGKDLGLRVLPIYGGQSMHLQLRALERGVDIVVATPGRAVDHIQRKTLDLSGVATAIMDEADEMLDMGFAESLDAIFAVLPATRQTALFSATMPHKILAISKKYLQDPVRITIAPKAAEEGVPARVREIAYSVQRPHKITALSRILDMENPQAVIVFCRTRGEVDEVSTTFNAHGYQTEALHGGLTQDQRDRVLKNFRDNVCDILVATDVAARGLDIDHLSHVVNYEVPSSPEIYVHRIGRTGRAGREGTAITLLDAREMRLLRNVEQYTKRKISIEAVPTVHELRERRLESVVGAVEEAIKAEALERFMRPVEDLAARHDPLVIAAAAMKLIDATMHGIGDEDADISIDVPKGFVKLFVNAGRKQGIGPGDLVGAITNLADISSKALGAITLTDRYALIEVPADKAEAIIKVLRNAVIKGNKVLARRDQGPPPPRKH